jgi:hypothetical protein
MLTMTQALSEFTEYVNKQQASRRPFGSSSSAQSKKTTGAVLEEFHDELSALDALDLEDSNAAPIRLKALLLDVSTEAEESLTNLKDWVSSRLVEGKGEALLDLGVEENGDSMNFTKEEWEIALQRLRDAAKLDGADINVLVTKNVGDSIDESTKKDRVKGCQGKVLVRRRAVTINDVIETRIAVVGNVDAGKSTLLGVLVKGGLDDGRGKARVNLFRHKHEIESGRTSSVGMEIMGFDSKGEIVMSTTQGRKLSWEEIGERSVCKSICNYKANMPSPKSSRSPTWPVTKSISVLPFLDSCPASPTTVC